MVKYCCFADNIDVVDNTNKNGKNKHVNTKRIGKAEVIFCHNNAQKVCEVCGMHFCMNHWVKHGCFNEDKIVHEVLKKKRKEMIL